MKQSVEYLVIFLPIGHLRNFNRASGSYTLKNSLLGADGQLIYLRHDKVMAPFINKNGYWDCDVSKLINSYLNVFEEKSIFLDIGANQGLVTMQVINDCTNLKNTEFILVEPVIESFTNLQKNFIELDTLAHYELCNFGLGVVSIPSTNAYTTKRNSTSTQHLNLVLDPKNKLETSIISIMSVSKFIAIYLDTKSYSHLIVKSDTDGSDLEIFDYIINSKLLAKISCYIIEVILTSISTINLGIFIHN